MRIFDSEFLQE